MKSSVPSPLLHNCSFLSREEYLERIEKALTGDTLTHIVTLNAEMCVEAEHNEAFRNAVDTAELKIPDGSSMLWARKYLSQKQHIFISLVRHFFSKEQSLTGADSVFDICEAALRKNISVYLLGGTQQESQGTCAVLQKKYPDLSLRIVDERLDIPSKPAVLFVAYGSPKQTLFIEEKRGLLEQAGVRIAIGVGGAFAMISGRLPRAPYWMRHHHIEWLWRLMIEPRRLKRIWNAVVVFPLLVRGYTH